MPPICIGVMVVAGLVAVAIVWSIMDMGSRCSREEEKRQDPIDKPPPP